ncbi:MAG: hypothetical protein PHU77_06360 [Simplicispira sp.]|nr:hypothetical protein [Simplicispira sp.]
MQPLPVENHALIGQAGQDLLRVRVYVRLQWALLPIVLRLSLLGLLLSPFLQGAP